MIGPVSAITRRSLLCASLSARVHRTAKPLQPFRAERFFITVLVQRICLALCLTLCNTNRVTTTLTIRLPSEQRRALRQRAAALKKSESEWVRSLITRDLNQSLILERVAHLVGSLDGARAVTAPHPLKKTIRERNWRT